MRGRQRASRPRVLAPTHLVLLRLGGQRGNGPLQNHHLGLQLVNVHGECCGPHRVNQVPHVLAHLPPALPYGVVLAAGAARPGPRHQHPAARSDAGGGLGLRGRQRGAGHVPLGPFREPRQHVGTARVGLRPAPGRRLQGALHARMRTRAQQQGAGKGRRNAAARAAAPVGGGGQANTRADGAASGLTPVWVHGNSVRARCTRWARVTRWTRTHLSARSTRA